MTDQPAGAPAPEEKPTLKVLNLKLTPTDAPSAPLAPEPVPAPTPVPAPEPTPLKLSLNNQPIKNKILRISRGFCRKEEQLCST